jgi:hypothetical protein
VSGGGVVKLVQAGDPVPTAFVAVTHAVYVVLADSPPMLQEVPDVEHPDPPETV